MFLFRLSCPPYGTNAILIACEETKRAAVIDPASGSAPVLYNKAQEKGFSIEKILLTHSHWDHIADLAELKKLTGAPIYVHRLDAGNVKNPGSDLVPGLLKVTATEPDVLMEDGEVIHVGHLRIEVIHTPGHARGAVCFYLPEQRTLFSGDTLFRGGIGILSLATSEPEKMAPSLRRLSELPSDTRVVPGHGGETTIGRENLGEDDI
jgi:hydroxyacylglutathione hydrolase